MRIIPSLTNHNAPRPAQTSLSSPATALNPGIRHSEQREGSAFSPSNLATLLRATSNKQTTYSLFLTNSINVLYWLSRLGRQLGRCPPQNMRLRCAVPKIPAKSSVPPRSPIRNRRYLPTHSDSTLPQVLIRLHFNSFIRNACTKPAGGPPNPPQSFATRHPPHRAVIPHAARILWVHSARTRSWQRAHINIIPRGLRVLCFHTLTHSFAHRKTLSPMFSAHSTLFPKHPGGVPLAPETRLSATHLPTRSPSVTIPPTPGAAHA
jgi:hypothetical protein